MSHNPYKDETYFWYSMKPDEHRNEDGDHATRYALIDGKKVLYTTCGEHKNGSPSWDDTQFLGRGKIARIMGLTRTVGSTT